MSVLEQDRLTFSAAGKLLGVHSATVWRWALRPNRHGLRLRSCLIGGIRFTTRTWIEEHIAATTAAAEGQRAPLPTLAKQDRVAEAKRQLAAKP
jgi:hypothetical protein